MVENEQVDAGPDDRRVVFDWCVNLANQGKGGAGGDTIMCKVYRQLRGV